MGVPGAQRNRDYSDLAVRICIIYDRFYPYRIGGADRWYRNLAVRLAEQGHEVTYLTLRQWGADENPDIGTVRVRAVGPRMDEFVSGRRRIGPPILFGLGVLLHLLRHGRRYDIVHTGSFPFFPVLAGGLARPLAGFRLVVDWHEVWTREYWREYVGSVRGFAGWWVQRLCLRVPQRAFCFSRLHERRLHEYGVRGEVQVLEGQYEGPPPVNAPKTPDSLVVFAGRHISEKQPSAVVPAVGLARKQIPCLRAVIYGDGPERNTVLATIRAHGLEGIVAAPGFVDAETIGQALGDALCLLLPSRREGYGLVLLEAMAKGTPVIVVKGPDNAATELVAEGHNGFVASSASPEDLAAAIERVHAAGQALRESTAAWFSQNARRLSLEESLGIVLARYRTREHVGS
jgi:glycosyltransferase involved in cell wall biosynthesis